MRTRLRDYCEIAFPEWEIIDVEQPNNISTGWESDVYAFKLCYRDRQWAERTRSLVLRLYASADAAEKAPREFIGMRRLRGHGYPVPKVWTMEIQASPFGRPFLIMDHIAGQPLWQSMFAAPAARRDMLVERFCELQVRLHALDWRNFVDDPDSFPIDAVERWLGLVRGYLDLYPLPGLRAVWEWLETRSKSVSARPLAVVHWDYHPDNVILCADDELYVIDWTQIEVSDPRFDLAWTLLLVGASEGESWRAVLLRAYERSVGAAIDDLPFFEVAACLKRLGSILISVRGGAEQLGMRTGAELLMLRQTDALGRVYDVLRDRSSLRVPEVEALLRA